MIRIIILIFGIIVMAITPCFPQGNDSLQDLVKTNPKTFKLAMIQMQVKGGEKQENMNHAIELIAEAAEFDADFVLLPECLDLGWTHPSSQKEAEAIPEGIPCSMLMQAAKANVVYICAGLTELSGEKTYNTAVIINDKGELIGKHRKLNEVIIGHDYYAQGNDLNVVETKYGNIGTMICSDGFAEEQVLSRSLCYMGADVILSPCAWAVDADHDNIKNPYGDFWRRNYIPVAQEFSIPIIGVSNVGWMEGGPWDGMKCIGSSLAIDHNGEDIIQGPYGVDAECILYVDINLLERPARGNGWHHYWREMGDRNK